MKQSVPESVDEYIAAQPDAVRPKLEQVRAAIRSAVPKAVEGIGYRMPEYKLHGKPMLYFAGFKEHYSLFAASGTFFAALEDELRGYELRKGTVHFPGRVEDWRRCSVGPAYLLLPVSVGSASLSGP